MFGFNLFFLKFCTSARRLRTPGLGAATAGIGEVEAGAVEVAGAVRVGAVRVVCGVCPTIRCGATPAAGVTSKCTLRTKIIAASMINTEFG